MCQSHSHPQPSTNAHQDSKYFDLDNVSGSDDDDVAEQGQSDNGPCDVVSTPVVNVSINNLEAVPTKDKSSAADIHYFFDRTGPITIYHVCKYIFCAWLF